MYRIAMAITLPIIVMMGWHALAITVFVIAIYLDFVDGAVARYQTDTEKHHTDPVFEASLTFLSRLRLKGCTETGKWLDPFADKSLIQVTLFTLGWSVLPSALLYFSLGLAILLTLARPIKRWMMKKGWRKSADGRANIFGKVKMWLEVALIVELFIVPNDFWQEIVHRSFREILMSTAIVAAFLSLVFHLMPARQKK